MKRARAADIETAIVAPVRADWSAWSAEQERKRIEHNIRETERVLNTPIYTREIAEKLADDYCQRAVPDWRLLLQENRGLVTKIVRAQPEYKQREVHQRGDLLRLIRDQLPRHMQPLVADLETITDLTTQAREAAAFLVGYCTGRKAERIYVDARGRTRTHRAKPSSAGLSLTLGAGE